MMSRAMVGLGVFLAALMLAGCGVLIGDDHPSADKTPDYRYRLTVEVDTPEGLRTGSSVVEVTVSQASATTIPNPGSVMTRVRGQAVVVDLPGEQTLFALLRSNERPDWAGDIMFLMAPSAELGVANPFQARFDSMLSMKGAKTLPRRLDEVNRNLEGMSAYPIMVSFADESDPTSVMLVDPDDLAATFGEGVALERITVELTEDTVTTGIEKRLVWMDDYRNKWIDGTSTVSEDLTTSELAAHLTSGSFSTKFAK